MSRLVDGLLLLARDEGDTATSSPVDVAAIVHERVDVWQDVVAEKSVMLVAETPATAWALAVPGAVDQLVDNLVDNALRVSPVRGRITVRVEHVPQGVVLHVLDEGPGLDADARARAFDRFWRAPDAEPGGSGLGLPIVRRLAEASGGSARLDARRPHGVDAVIELRAALAPAFDHAVRAST